MKSYVSVSIHMIVVFTQFAVEYKIIVTLTRYRNS